MKQLPRKSGGFLFEIIMRRCEVRSTIMTSNRPLEDWRKLLGDVPSATAILDRFLHHAEIVSMNGKSYRLRNRAGGELATSGGDAADGQSVNDSKTALPPAGTADGKPVKKASRR